MQGFTDQAKSIFFRHRKKISVAAASFGLVFLVALAGMGLLVYKAASVAVAKMNHYSASQIDPNISIAPPGFLEGVALGVASRWLVEGGIGSEFVAIHDGLKCLDALGGPSPVAIVRYVQKNTDNANLAFQLDALTERLNANAGAANGPFACVNWMMNS